MIEFILTLLGVTLVAGFASMLVPEGKGGSLRTYLGFACGLCALSVTVGPILSFIGILADGKTDMFYNFSEDVLVYDYKKVFEDTLSDKGEAAVESELKSLLCREYSIKEDNVDVDVRLAYSNEGFTAGGVTVTLRGSAVFVDAHKIAEHVSSLTSCECRVVYGGKNDAKE